MADFYVDENGVARPDQPSKKDDNHKEKKSSFGSEFADGFLKSYRRQIERTCSILSVIREPISGTIGMQWDRKMDKDKRVKLVKQLRSEIPYVDLVAPSIEWAEIADLKECNRFKLPLDEMKALASQLLQSAVTNGIVASTFSGALQCNIDISKLAHSQDGFLRGFAMSEGKIAEQAKFTEIPSVNITPMLAFQIASMITGQYYQHIITTQLKSISQKLNQVLSLLEEEDKAIINDSFRQLQELSSFDSFGLEDSIVLRTIQNNAGKLREKYKSLVLKINVDNVERSWFRDKGEAEDWFKALNDSKFVPYMQVAFMAEYLFYCSNMVLLEREFAKPKSERDNGRIDAWSKHVNNDFMAPYVKKYHDVKWTVLLNLELLKEGALWWNEDIEKLYQMTFNQFNSFDTGVLNTLAQLNPIYSIEYKDGKLLEPDSE